MKRVTDKVKALFIILAVTAAPLPALAGAGRDTSEAPPENQEYVIRPVSFSLLPGVSTNFGTRGRARNFFSLNLLADWNHSLAGFEFSLVGAARTEEVSGLQAALGANYCGGEVRGAQVSGITSLARKSVNGFQAALAVNYAGEARWFQGAWGANIARNRLAGIQGSLIGNYAGSVRGFQGAAAVNISRGEVTGAQGSLGVNYAGSVRGVQGAQFVNVARGGVRGVQGDIGLNYAGSVRGVQIGLCNIAPGEVRGLQFGFLNYGGTVHGTQLGVVSIAKELQGVSFGFFKFVGNGVLKPLVWTSDTSYINVGLKTGTRRLFGILGMGLHPLGELPYASTLLGLGVFFGFSPGWLEIDLVRQQLHTGVRLSQLIGSVNKLRVTLGLRIAKQFSIFIGPTLNVIDAAVRDEVSWGPRLGGWVDAQGDELFSVGFQMGLQCEPRWRRLNRHQ